MKRQIITILLALVVAAGQAQEFALVRRDIQKQSSLSTQKGRGMSMSFAEHLTEHILQLNLLVWSKCCNPLFQSALVNRPNLIGNNFAVAPVYLASKVAEGADGEITYDGPTILLIAAAMCEMENGVQYTLFSLPSRMDAFMGGKSLADMA